MVEKRRIKEPQGRVKMKAKKSMLQLDQKPKKNTKKIRKDVECDEEFEDGIPLEDVIDDEDTTVSEWEGSGDDDDDDDY